MTNVFTSTFPSTFTSTLSFVNTNDTEITVGGGNIDSNDIEFDFSLCHGCYWCYR